MRAVYEDKKINAKNICFTLVSPHEKEKTFQSLERPFFTSVVPHGLEPWTT